MCVLIAGVVAKRGSLERPPFPTNFDVHRLDPDDRLTSIRDIKSVATTFRFGLIPAVSMAAAREIIYDARDPERCV